MRPTVFKIMVKNQVVLAAAFDLITHFLGILLSHLFQNQRFVMEVCLFIFMSF